MDYYDRILTGIFACMISGVFLGITTAIPANLAVAAGAALSTGFMYHGMFQNTPISAGTGHQL